MLSQLRRIQQPRIVRRLARAHIKRFLVCALRPAVAIDTAVRDRGIGLPNLSTSRSKIALPRSLRIASVHPLAASSGWAAMEYCSM